MPSKFAQNLNSKLDSKKVQRGCECCGSNHWLLLTNFNSIVLQADDTPGLTSLPVIVLECSNCGNLRIFRKERLIGDNDT